MVSIGGTGWMLLFAAVAGLFALVIGLGIGRRMGVVAGVAWFGLFWSIAVIAIVTLVPAQNGLGYIPADEHATSCSWDIGGPAPGGFWIFGRWRLGWLLVPLGLVALAAYSLGIEEVQLHVARIDRACDVTDIIDNVSGATLGVAIGLALLPLVRPWRAGPATSRR